MKIVILHSGCYPQQNGNEINCEGTYYKEKGNWIYVKEAEKCETNKKCLESINEKIKDESAIIFVHHLYKDKRKRCIKDAIEKPYKGERMKVPYNIVIKNFTARITNLMDKLEMKGKTVKKVEEAFRKIYLEEMRYRILMTLAPLHLSLQAFFGISRDENGGWVRIGRDENYKNRLEIDVDVFEQAGIKKTEDIDNEFKKHFPNTDAFLLVEEAKWDFYASMFDKVIPNCEGMREGCPRNCLEEEEEYEKDKKIAFLLKHFIENIDSRDDEKKKLQILKETLEKNYGEENSANGAPNIWFQVDQEPITYAKFVKTLREICAILANTPSCEESQGHSFIYKGKCDAARDEILQEIWNKTNNELEKTRHCKLPNVSTYEKLKEQILEWGRENDFEKVKIVIQGIEELAECLRKILQNGICQGL